MRKKTIWLTESQVEWLEYVSRVTGEKQSVIIRHSIDEYLRKISEGNSKNGNEHNERTTTT